MTKLLLIHNSDNLFETHRVREGSERPVFYWYTDRFVSFQGTQKYLYIFLVDPIEDSVELRSRSHDQGFNGLHKDFLHYKAWIEGRHDEECWCISRNLSYAESGIAMTFSDIKPVATLMNRYYGSSREEWMATDFEIISPVKPFSKRVIKLFNKPYDELHQWEPTPFADIPELVDLIPELKDAYPIKRLERGEDGKYHYDKWNPISTVKEGVWWI